MKKNSRGYLKRSFTFEGKRYYVYGKTAKELNEKETKRREELKNRLDTRNTPTLREYACKRLEYSREKRGANTARNLAYTMDFLCNIHIESAGVKLGELKLVDIKTDDIREVQKELRKGRKTSTVNNYMSKLNSVLNDAVKEQLISYNPFGLISTLKRTEEKARDTYHRALTKEEQELFFNSEYTKKSGFYNVFCMAVNTGMRIGEIGALKYKDIKSNDILVQRSLTMSEDGHLIIGEEPKTEAGKRTVPINDDVRKVLERQKTLNEYKKDSNVINMDELLFTGPYGGLLRDQSININIKNICEKIGIEVFTVHAFRDTFATRAIENNMNPRTLQAILGHSDYGMTMNLYGHVLEETMRIEMMNLHIV